MYQSYAIRPVGNQTLFNPGGFFDQTAAVDQTAVLDFVGQFYPTVAGLFRSNYFRESLVNRGLLDCRYGPKLKNLPFFEDANPMVSSLRRFVSTFVNSYYTRSSYLNGDYELQAWIAEANTQAEVLDFPPAPLRNTQTLIDILTQMAYLTGANHHLLNSNAPSYITGLLPFHPSAFFKPLPTSKGIQDITPYLADLEHAMYQVTLQLRFQRLSYRPSTASLWICSRRVRSTMGLLCHGRWKKRRRGLEVIWRALGRRLRGRDSMRMGSRRGCRLFGRC